MSKNQKFRKPEVQRHSFVWKCKSKNTIVTNFSMFSSKISKTSGKNKQNAKKSNENQSYAHNVEPR